MACASPFFQHRTTGAPLLQSNFWRHFSDSLGNLGACINISRKDNGAEKSIRPELNYSYKTFEAVPHPTVRPMKYAGVFGGML